MPCNDGRGDVHNPYYQQEVDRLSKRCNMLTNLLCMTGRARYNKTNIPEAVLVWWEAHCKLDKSRGEPW